MGGSSASTGGGGGGVGPAGLVTKTGKTGTVKDAKKTSNRNELRTLVKKGGIIGSVTKPFRDATEEVNRKFYNEKVVPAGKSKAPNYETYMKDRLAGKTDAYGNTTNNQGGDGENTIKKVTETAPTVAEIDEATTNTEPTETATTTEANRLLKIKKRGRSKSIMTTAKGVTKTSSDYTLGVKNLLGRV